MIFGWAGHRWRWIKWRAFADFMMIMGAVLLTAGIWVGVEEKADWKLDNEQKDGLAAALRKQPNSFEVWFYPLGRGSGRGPDRYATEIFKIFLGHNWPVRIPQTNWVSPNAKGLAIATCPNAQMTSIQVLAVQGILNDANIKYSHTTEEDLIKHGCGVGLVIGRYPSLYERLNVWLEENF